MTRLGELTRAEWLKARTTRTTLGLVLGAALLTVASVVAVVAGSSRAELEGGDGIRRVLSNAGTSSTVFSLCLGIIGMAGEYRHRTLAHTLMAVSTRRSAVVAKLLVHVALGLVVGLVAAALAVAIAAPWMDAKGAGFGLTDGLVLRIVGGTLVSNACFAAIGVGLGALLKEQVLALLVGVGWMFIVDSIVPGVLPEVGRFLPGGAQAAVLRQRTDGMLDQPLGVAVLLGYVALFAALGAAFLSRRDVT